MQKKLQMQRTRKLPRRVVPSIEPCRTDLSIQLTHEQSTLAAQMKQLESDLAENQQIKHTLDLQKIENGRMKDTIDSLSELSICTLAAGSDKTF